MEDVIKILIGVAILILGIPIGNFLARQTKEELKLGQIWFKLLIILCLLFGGISLIFRNDVLMFSFFFIAIVVSRCLIIKK